MQPFPPLMNIPWWRYSWETRQPIWDYVMIHSNRAYPQRRCGIQDIEQPTCERESFHYKEYHGISIQGCISPATRTTHIKPAPPVTRMLLTLCRSEGKSGMRWPMSTRSNGATVLQRRSCWSWLSLEMTGDDRLEGVGVGGVIKKGLWYVVLSVESKDQNAWEAILLISGPCVTLV